MQQLTKLAVGLVALVGAAILVDARWGDSLQDPSPAAKQLREQFEAIEAAAGVPVDRRGCQALHQFASKQPIFYECPISAAQLDLIRPALSARGWQQAPPSREIGFTLLQGDLRARLSCDAQGERCRFRIEAIPRPAGA